MYCMHVVQISKTLREHFRFHRSAKRGWTLYRHFAHDFERNPPRMQESGISLPTGKKTYTDEGAVRLDKGPRNHRSYHMD